MGECSQFVAVCGILGTVGAGYCFAFESVFIEAGLLLGRR